MDLGSLDAALLFVAWTCRVFLKGRIFWNTSIWVFPKIGVPQNGWFIMENRIKMDDLGVPPFKETPIQPGRTPSNTFAKNAAY